MSNADSFTDQYAKEAAERWPEEYVASNLKLKSMSKEDQQKSAGIYLLGRIHPGMA